VIRTAAPDDADRMAELAEQKRQAYREHAPVFHRPKEGARPQHARFLASLLNQEHVLALVHEAGGAVDGFVVAMLVLAPPVYDPGGVTCAMDDFCVATPDLWTTVGRELLEAAIERARPRGGGTDDRRLRPTRRAEARVARVQRPRRRVGVVHEAAVSLCCGNTSRGWVTARAQGA
jgi:GNAT superfamily N-acetyltransferase